jgi:hypothetical protein
VHFDQPQDRGQLEDELERQLVSEELDAAADSYWRDWLSIAPNRILHEPLPQRPIHFCVLDAHPSSDLAATKKHFEGLKQQSYANWTAVYFAEGEAKEVEDYAKETGVGVRVVRNQGSVGRNYEVGIIKHCPPKSFVLVLRRNESIEGTEGLAQLAKVLVPRPVLGAYVSVRTEGGLREPTRTFG